MIKTKKLDSYCQNLQAFVAMAVIKILNENQAFRPTRAIHERNKYQFIPKNCLQHILLFIKTNIHVNTVLILLIIFPPIHQRLFFQNINFFM